MVGDLRKYLGRIDSVKFGYTGYQEAMMGLSISFRFDGSSGICTHISGGWQKSITVGEHTKWTEEDRNRQRAELVEKIDQLLSDAKVDDVYKLVGIPVEITLEGMSFKDFRILKEVL